MNRPIRAYAELINGMNYVQRVGDAERVTSVVTAYAPGPELLASIRSLAAQSWTNHEILLVDDGSPHGHDDVLRAATKLDPRVRLLRRPAHEGRYVARNAAMDRATGAYVSFQEADSWSHPRRLERQVAALRADPAAGGVTCPALLTGADLTIVRGPLLIRRTTERFDRVRHAGEDEFLDRLGSVVHLDGESLAVLLRRDGDRMEAARHAYRSAYRAWHRRSAGPPPVKPWPLLDRRGRRACDVLMVADWTREDAGLGQLRALKNRGLRVMVLHMGGQDDLDARTQEAINDGEADLVDRTDDVRARLVVVRDPRILDNARTSGIRATRVVLEATDAPQEGAAAARSLFGADPLWAPSGPHSRAALGDLKTTELDVPHTVDADRWRVDRRDIPASRPVVGRQCAGGRHEWHRLRAELPEHPMLDVRLRDGAGTARQAFGYYGPPTSWLVYAAAEVSARAFLQQVDFYPALPAARTPADAEPGVLAALAAGCVVVLPHRYEPAYGDAAVYSTVEALADTVRTLHGRRGRVAEQRDRADEFVRRVHGHDTYADRISALTP